MGASAAARKNLEKWLEGLGKCREEGAQGLGLDRLRGHRGQVRCRQGAVRQGQVLALMGRLADTVATDADAAAPRLLPQRRGAFLPDFWRLGTRGPPWISRGEASPTTRLGL